MKLRFSDRTEEILDDMAAFVAAAEADGAGKLAHQIARVARAMLFDAAAIAYREAVDHLGTTAAVAWINSRIEEKIGVRRNVVVEALRQR